MKDHPDYKYLSDQGLVANAGEILGQLDKPSEGKIEEIYNKVLAQDSLDSHTFYSNLYGSVQKEFPFFSSRDIRNIQSAISLRLTDFNLPEDWFEKPELYFQKEYDTKLSMLKELMTANMKGLNFADIRKQEVIRYLDNFASIADMDFERKVKKHIESIITKQEAFDRIDQNK